MTRLRTITRIKKCTRIIIDKSRSAPGGYVVSREYSWPGVPRNYSVNSDRDVDNPKRYRHYKPLRPRLVTDIRIIIRALDLRRFTPSAVIRPDPSSVTGTFAGYGQ